MNIKKIILIVLLVVFACKTESKIDIWITEKPNVKYTKSREKEVWGKTLKGYDPELFYGTVLADAAVQIQKGNNDELEKSIALLSKNEINYQEENLKLL